MSISSRERNAGFGVFGGCFVLSLVTHGERPQSRTWALCFLRDFLNCLCDSHETAQSIRSLFPTIPANKECTLPSAYSPHEVAKIIDNISDDATDFARKAKGASVRDF